MTSTRPASRSTSVILALSIAVLILVSGLLLGGGAPGAVPAGLPDAGALTGWLVAGLALTNDILTLAVVAGLLMPLLSTAKVGGGHTMGRLSGARFASTLCVPWLLVIAAWCWFAFADVYARPPSQVHISEVWGFVRQVDQGTALLWQFCCVAVIAVAARFARTFGQVFAVCVLALATIAPRILTGHASSSGNHDLALVALLLHAGAAVVWIGGLIALTLHLGDRPGKRELAAHRFSLIATIAIAVLAVSGLISAWVRLGSAVEFFTTGYGIVALAKVLLLGGLALLGLRLRRQVRGTLENWSDFARVASVELILMLSAVALGVALSRTPPPVGKVLLTNAEILLGQPLPPAPTMARILWGFTPSGVGLAVLSVGVIGYAIGLWTLHRRGDAWPLARSVSWFFGIAIVGYSTMGGLGVYSHVLFSAHMVSHMLLGMLAPIFLVIGSPITLALRALPGGPTPDEDGPRQVLSFILRTWYFRVLTNPFFVVSVFLISLYGVYLTDFFDTVMLNHVGHAWMQIHFLISGYLLFELVIGNDPVPVKLGYPAKLILLLAIAPFHAFFAISVMDGTRPIGGRFYALLDRPYRTDLLADQHYAGAFVWAFGELPTLVVVLALLAQWFISDQRQAKRFDLREERAGEDSELAEYNRRLAAANRKVDEHDAAVAQARSAPQDNR